jgi:threonine/homoserine/homoserine lactone efflux protein
MTALGVFCALLIHISYCVLGIAVVIVSSPFLFNLIKYLGSIYLFYLGIVMLITKSKPVEQSASRGMKKQRPFVSGFLCNLLNPKATLFILGLFTQFIDPSMSMLQKIAIGSVIPLVALVWFIFLSYLITHRLLFKHFARFQAGISKVMGVVICGLALYIIFSPH